MAIQQIIVPDVGGATDVEVIDVLVNVGDQIDVDDSIITLESDKASMDVPASHAGVVTAVAVSVGDKLNEGDIILSIETDAQASPQIDAAKPAVVAVPVPDVGGATDVEVIEVTVAVGDEIDVDDSLITLESDKASMDVPSPHKGKVLEVQCQVGDKVNEGTTIVMMEVLNAPTAPAPKPQTTQSATKPAAQTTVAKPADMSAYDAKIAQANRTASIYAGPAVRRIAQEFGVDLTQVKGTGRKARILKIDVQNYVKQRLQGGGGSGAGLDLLPWPTVDFAKFGEVEVKPLNKIKRLTAANLHRNWVMIPHVTQLDEADITELEKFRKANKAAAAEKGYKLTPIVFIMKAVVAALKEYPSFNASLDPSGENLVLKKYFNVGVAVDTPNGLVVPVLRDADKKSIYELAGELTAISQKAREKGLAVQDMQGGNFAISSLGGIGGTAFTPIVNAPDVAILGVSKAQIKPQWIDGEFQPRLMLPLCLSYDHRVIDGAEAARFITYLSQRLADVDQLREML